MVIWALLWATVFAPCPGADLPRATAAEVRLPLRLEPLREGAGPCGPRAEPGLRRGRGRLQHLGALGARGHGLRPGVQEQDGGAQGRGEMRS